MERGSTFLFVINYSSLVFNLDMTAIMSIEDTPEVMRFSRVKIRFSAMAISPSVSPHFVLFRLIIYSAVKPSPFTSPLFPSQWPPAV
jgi:hypothetical protein